MRKEGSKIEKIIYSIIISTIAGLSTMLGGLLCFLPIKKENVTNFLTFSLSLALVIMIYISVIDLLPSSFLTLTTTYGLLKGILLTILTFFIGYLIVKTTRRFVDQKNKNNLYQIGVLSMIILLIHNLPEGIATFMTSYEDIYLGITLSIAIMLHNIPEGISIAIPIYFASKSRGKALKFTFLSGIAEPIGAILAWLFLAPYINDVLISFILIIVAGIMITLAINKLFMEAISYNNHKYIYIGFISGLTLMIISEIIFKLT